MSVLSDSAACGPCPDTVWPGDVPTAKYIYIYIKKSEICGTGKENCIGGVSFASSSFCHKNLVARLHFHWLKGPKCKLTQIIEAFALIKHSMRAFKESTLSHWSFALWTIDLYIPSFNIGFDPLRLCSPQIHLHYHTFGILQSQIWTYYVYFSFLNRDVT